MTTYHAYFRGRKVGAIGRFYFIHAKQAAETMNDVSLALYDRFEHITDLKVYESEQPILGKMPAKYTDE